MVTKFNGDASPPPAHPTHPTPPDPHPTPTPPHPTPPHPAHRNPNMPPPDYSAPSWIGEALLRMGQGAALPQGKAQARPIDPLTGTQILSLYHHTKMVKLYIGFTNQVAPPTDMAHMP